MKNQIITFFLIAVGAMQLPAAAPAAAKSTFAIGDADFLMDGKPFLIKAGEVHPARIPQEYWAHRLKMIHALGLNTVSIYVFWSQHEPVEGKFDFTGNADIAKFVRLAQQEGLWVIVRPGPYTCAEWEFGGYPWWLLKSPAMKVRSQDERFLKASENYMKQIGEQLAPLQITRGGPIIMLQVENEYGSYGGDHVYMGKVRDMARAAGFEVPLFTADGGGHMMANGSLPDVLPGLNGGNGPTLMKEIGKYRPTGPWFVPELYPGWLDHWGEPHAQTGLGVVNQTRWNLNNKVSFCYYMVHGGTSFGFTAGANFGGRFQPQPTSYDYDAPIDEAGRATKKYLALREVLAAHIASGETLPAIPPATPVIQIPPINFTESVALTASLSAPVKSEKPLSFEDLDQGYGYVLYRTKISGPVDAMLKIKELRDYAVVSVDGRRIATLDRRNKQDSLPLIVTNSAATLDILVENGGRINYGGELPNNRKGITESVTLGDRELTGWEMFKFPFTDLSTLRFGEAGAAVAPFVARGSFELSEVGDAFLDLRGWGKGIVIVNGHNLGRYWYIGPQQTLYLPGCWLRKGRNEIVVFEQIKDGIRPIAGVAAPVLNQLNKDGSAPVRSKVKEPKFPAPALVQEGALANGAAAQAVDFPARKARYLGLQALSSQNGDEFTTLAELTVVDAAGKVIPAKNWKVAYVDSEENFAEGDQAEKAFDGDESSFWHSLWSAPHPKHPHTLVVDLGAEVEVSGVRLLPRQNSPNGRIKNYRLYLDIKPF